jgi:hypothetical protein
LIRQKHRLFPQPHGSLHIQHAAVAVSASAMAGRGAQIRYMLEHRFAKKADVRAGDDAGRDEAAHEDERARCSASLALIASYAMQTSCWWQKRERWLRVTVISWVETRSRSNPGSVLRACCDEQDRPPDVWPST